MSNRLRRRRLHFLFGWLLLIASISCGSSGKIDQAHFRMEKGDFDGALEILQREYYNDPGNPIVLANLGLVLSVNRGTRIASIQLLDRSLKLRRDPDVYRELFLLYIDTGMIEEARRMISPEYLTVDDFFRSEISIMRKAIACLDNPQKNQIKEILKEDATGFRDYMAIRCMVDQRFPNLQKGDLYSILNVMNDDLHKCESINMIPDKYVIDSFNHSLSLKECRKKYPGSLLMNREILVKNNIVDSRKMFDDSIFIPATPDFSEKNRNEPEFTSPITTGLPEGEHGQ